jgi:hypothetical protein
MWLIIEFDFEQAQHLPEIEQYNSKDLETNNN